MTHLDASNVPLCKDALLLRRRSLVMASLAGLCGAVHAQQASLTARPIRILVGVGAGGAIDTIARLFAVHLGQVLKTPIIVENRAGAFQTIAIRTLIDAPPDGHTLFLANGSALSLAPATDPNLPYNPSKDFTFVGQIGTWSAVIIAKTELPVRSLAELVRYSKENPTKLNYGSAGVGTGSHLKVEYLKSVTGLRATHIPYKSDADVLRELTMGDVHLALATTLSSVPSIKAGKAKAIAVTSRQELPYLPGVPSVSESGFKGLDALEPYSYLGLLAPAKLPEELTLRINAAVNAVSAMPEVQTRMREVLYTEPVIGTPHAFQVFSEQELEKAKQVAKLVKL